MNKNSKRFLSFIIGIVLCLIVLEIGLRVVGLLYARMSQSDTVARQSGSTTILCVGDSVTFGIGAPRGLSYPAQLQTLLNESGEGSKKIVINRGWPGQNSTQMLMRLERWLNEFQPEIVTILIGAQNLDNYYGYKQFLEQSNKQGRGFLSTAHDSLDNIRVYKFFRLLTIHAGRYLETSKPEDAITRSDPREEWQGEEYPNEVRVTREEPTEGAVQECSEAIRFKQQGDYTKALESIFSVTDSGSVQQGCYNVLGAIYLEQNQHELAVKWFKRGIEHDPARFDNYEGIGESYRNKDQCAEAITWFERGFDQARYDSLHEHSYRGIGLCFEKLGQYERAIKFFSKEVKRKPLVEDYLHSLAGDYLVKFQSSREKKPLHDWIAADIENILQMCHRYKARTILQSYPNVASIEPIYRNIAGQQKIPYVDQQAIFKPFIDSDGRRNPDYFAPDGHPNEKGYHLMARELFKALQKME